jgi:general secretion pathway protein F
MRFQYRAINSQGAPIQGELDASSDRDALNILSQQNLTPVMVELAGQPTAQANALQPSTRARKVSAEDTALALQELGTLVQAGIPLAEATQSLAESHTGAPTGKLFSDVRRYLGGGDSLSASLTRAAGESKVQFPNYIPPLIKAAEATGEVGPALLSGSQQMLADAKARSETISALIYPMILVAVGIAVTLYIFVSVVPNFANVIKNARTPPPEFSRNVILLGVWLKANLIWVLGAAAAVIALTVGALQQRSVREQCFEWLSNQPIIGPWLISSQVARWSGVFGALIQARVPIVDAMELAQNTLGIPNMRRKLDVARKSLRQGERLASVLQPTGLLRPTALNLIRVGEKSSDLANMLFSVSKLEGEAATERRKRVMTLIEPAAIILIGLAVGTIMYSLVSAMQAMTVLR